jgi:hypothetical protein
MTIHQVSQPISKNADAILIMGSNAADHRTISLKWVKALLLHRSERALTSTAPDDRRDVMFNSAHAGTRQWRSLAF